MGRDYLIADIEGWGQFAGSVMSVTMAHDGWFGEGAAQWQQAASAVFRAVENGVPVKEGVRWAQDGGLTTTGAITFGPSYGVAPVVVAINADGTNLTPIVTAVTTSAASVRVYTYNGTLASSSTVFWTSIGTVVGW